MDTEYISVTETAKLVRAALKKAFPKVKFSVNSSKYAGGASIRVHWTDGPINEAVKRVIDGYAGGGFDGMIDMKYNVSTWLMPDGSVAAASSPGTSGSMGVYEGYNYEAPGPGAKKVRFMADYVFADRDISPGLKQRALDKVRETLALDEDISDVKVEPNKWGDGQLSRNPYFPKWSADLSTLVYRETVKRAVL